MIKLINKREFARKYTLDIESITKAKIKWKDLQLVHEDYVNIIPSLERTATYIFNTLMKVTSIQSIRYRIKDPEHLIAKIIRKRIQDPKRVINKSNYKSEITDLIGIRVIHLYKEQWQIIHEQILSNWDLNEKPIIYFRSGDNLQLKEFSKDFDFREHESGYRSIHYVVETKPSKQTFFAEIQVRTIFEEAWSEIDHNIRYPNISNNPLFSQFLMILNRLAGSADEMGSYIVLLKDHLSLTADKNSKLLSQKDDLINDLQAKIDQLKLKSGDTSYLKDSLEDLRFFPSKSQLTFTELENIVFLNSLRSPFGSLPIFDDALVKNIEEATKGIAKQFLAINEISKPDEPEEE